MPDDRDLHIFSSRVPWPKGNPIGTLQVEYEVRRFVDVRNLSAGRAYRISVVQRVSIPSNGADDLGTGQVKSFTYPIMVRAGIKIAPGSTGQECYLVEVSPKTLNASVSTAVTGSKSSSDSSSSTVTTGSTTSQVNNYLFGLDTGSSGSSSSTFKSAAQGEASGRSAGSASSNTISIKDWSSYVTVDAAYRNPSWIWAQTFPWDVIKYHYTDGTEAGNVSLPVTIWNLLFPPDTLGPKNDIQLVNPPSEISLFGPDFAMQAEWVYRVDNSAPSDLVSFTHVVTPYTGFHGFAPQNANSLVEQLAVRLSVDGQKQINWPSPDLDLGQLALDAILPGDPTPTALIGFVGSKFITAPNDSAGFSILSAANTLLIRGSAGSPFAAPVNDDAPMTADLTGGKVVATMTAYFKVIDDDGDLRLNLKHWITENSGRGVRVRIEINAATPITLCVEAKETGGGGDNISSVYLRRKRFNGDAYFDYVKPGLNQVVISVTADMESASPIVTAPVCGYAIRAISIT